VIYLREDLINLYWPNFGVIFGGMGPQTRRTVT